MDALFVKTYSSTIRNLPKNCLIFGLVDRYPFGADVVDDLILGNFGEIISRDPNEINGVTINDKEIAICLLPDVSEETKELIKFLLEAIIYE